MSRLANEFSWSVSRAQLFEECRRAYYYQYYGSWGGWEIGADERVRHIYLLKNLRNLNMWAGSIVHEVIAEALNRFARSSHPVQAGELQARARQKLRDGWVEAVSGKWRQAPKKTNLFELYYGNGKSLPEESTTAVKERVYGCLEALAQSDLLKQVLTIPYMNWKPVDTLDSFQVDGLKIWCAVDFAYTDNDGFLQIIDWKTGGENRDALDLQLACYAFYANEVWHNRIDRIRLQGVFLRENARVSTYDIGPERLVEARAAILESAARMREYTRDVVENKAEEDDFPCCEIPRVCARCNYREICPGAGERLFPESRPER